MARALDLRPGRLRPAGRRTDTAMAYALAGGALAVVALFTIYPVGYALVGSLYNLSPILPRSFAGLSNYGLIFGSPYFGFALKTTAVLLLAAMQAIPDELYEAAALDGAGGLRAFAAVTLPHIQPMLVVVTLFEILVALTAFDLIFALTGGGPGTATTVLSYFIWAESFKMLSFGTGLALGAIIAGLSLVLIAALMRLMPREALVGEGR